MLKKFTWIAALFAALAMVFAGCSNFGALDDETGPKPAEDLEITGADITLTAIGSNSSAITIDKNKVTIGGTTSAGFYYEFPPEAAEYTNFELYFKVLEIKKGRPGLLIKRNTQMNNPIGITDNDDPAYQLNDADSPAKGGFPAFDGLHYEVGETYTTGVWKKNRFDSGIGFQHQAWNPDGNSDTDYTLEITLVVFIGGGGEAPTPPPEYVGDNTKVVFTAGATAALNKVVDNDPSVTGAAVAINSKTGVVSFSGEGSVSYKFPESYTVGTKKDAVTTPLDIAGDYDFVEIEYTISALALTKGSSFKAKVVQYGGGWNGTAYGSTETYPDLGGAGTHTLNVQTWGAGGKGGIQIHYNTYDIEGTFDFKITKVTFTKGTRYNVNLYSPITGLSYPTFEVLDGNGLGSTLVTPSATRGFTFNGWYAGWDGLGLVKAGPTNTLMSGEALTVMGVKATGSLPVISKSNKTFFLDPDGNIMQDADTGGSDLFGTTTATTDDLPLGVIIGYYMDSSTPPKPVSKTAIVIDPAKGVSLYAYWFNAVLPPITITAAAGKTLFTAVDSYAGGTTPAAVYTYPATGTTAAEYWIVSDSRTGQYDDWTVDAVAPFDEGDGLTLGDAIKALQNSYGSTAGYTRIGYVFPTEALVYDRITITYDLVHIGGTTGVLIRDGSNGTGSLTTVVSPNLDAGTGKTVTIPMSSFTGDGVSMVKNNAGAYLLRITKIEFTFD